MGSGPKRTFMAYHWVKVDDLIRLNFRLWRTPFIFYSREFWKLQFFFHWFHIHSFLWVQPWDHQRNRNRLLRDQIQFFDEHRCRLPYHIFGKYPSIRTSWITEVCDLEWTWLWLIRPKQARCVTSVCVFDIFERIETFWIWVVMIGHWLVTWLHVGVFARGRILSMTVGLQRVACIGSTILRRRLGQFGRFGFYLHLEERFSTVKLWRVLYGRSLPPLPPPPP